VGHTVLKFEANYLNLYIDYPDGRQKVPVTMLKIGVFGQARVFQPGEQTKETAVLNHWLNKTFPTPGNYRLHLQFTSIDGKAHVWSKPLELEIVQPDGLEAQAVRFIRDHSNPTYFFTGIEAVKNPEQLQVLENFVAEYGDSAYGDDASFALAEVQFALRDYQKARTTFEKLSKKTNYVFAAKASDFLKMIEQRTDRP
jgi:hypothetical protein